MLDRLLLPALKPPLSAIATRLVRLGVGADTVTWVGFAIGMAACVSIALGAYGAGLVLMAVSRCADGLDGAVARLTAPTDRGAFLDIVLDFIFYAGVPLAFAFADPDANALAAAVLIASFIGTGASFLAFAAAAAKRGLHNADYPAKGLYYLGGLTEATETLACFALMGLWPSLFPVFAGVFAAMCAVTTVSRIAAGWVLLK